MTWRVLPHARKRSMAWKVFSPTADVLYYVTTDRRLARRLRRYWGVRWVVTPRGVPSKEDGVVGKRSRAYHVAVTLEAKVEKRR